MDSQSSFSISWKQSVLFYFSSIFAHRVTFWQLFTSVQYRINSYNSNIRNVQNRFTQKKENGNRRAKNFNPLNFQLIFLHRITSLATLTTKIKTPSIQYARLIAHTDYFLNYWKYEKNVSNKSCTVFWGIYNTLIILLLFCFFIEIRRLLSIFQIERYIYLFIHWSSHWKFDSLSLSLSLSILIYILRKTMKRRLILIPILLERYFNRNSAKSFLV